MCGIAGFLSLDFKRPAKRDVLKKMTDVISHRGPDGEGFFVNGPVGLGHRRLSIIDLDTGDQPMYNDDRSIALVFNGEIYNYIELREELKKQGHVFKTPSDTEVVIRAYEQWGDKCQGKFNGMWALALWDDKKQTLFLSRDRLGEKPLYYARTANTFVFASEIKSIFAFGVPKEPRPELLEIYTTFKNIPAPFTFFKNIEKLLPGHFMKVDRHGPGTFKYWDMPGIDEQNLVKDKTSVFENFEELFRDAVRLRMRSDVPFGAFLSGGLDSASIVALMSEISAFPVKTFTIGYDQKEYDETELANLVAQKFKTEHHRGKVSADTFDETLKKIAFHYDEPFGDSSAIPTGYVSRFATKHVKMVLTGDGGDEALSGYPAYQGVKFADEYRRLPAFLRDWAEPLVKTVARMAPGSLRYKMNRFHHLIATASDDFNGRLLNKRAKPNIGYIQSVINPAIKTISAREYLTDFMQDCPYQGDFYRQMYFNYKFDLPNDYLVKVDRMSMAHSLETRLPFLDHRLVEYLAGVDKSVKMPGWERKHILRKTIARKLPPQLLSAPKRGFRVPVREWFKEDDLKNHILSLVRKNDFIDFAAFNKLMDENQQGMMDHGNILWSLTVLGEILQG